MKIKKGGYAVKNGFYIKNDCKNNELDGSVDEDGYILDPLTYERIQEGKIIQLSDGLCYENSRGLAKNIRKRNSLPFGHPLTLNDEAKLTTPTPSLSSILEPITPSESTPHSEHTPPFVIPPPPNVLGFIPEWHPPTRSYILRREQPQIQSIPEEVELIQVPRRRTTRTTRTTGRTRNRPVLIIESDSTEEIQPEPAPTPRRRGRPPGSRNRITRGNTGRGKKRNKSKKH
jgi:hypothetical protein